MSVQRALHYGVATLRQLGRNTWAIVRWCCRVVLVSAYLVLPELATDQHWRPVWFFVAIAVVGMGIRWLDVMATHECTSSCRMGRKQTTGQQP
jgi:hypothetical protein